MLFLLNKNHGDFYIQLKGNNAGKPLHEPIPNSIGITANPNVFVPAFLYYTMLAVYQAGHYKKYLKGTAVPYIRHSDIAAALIDFYASNGMLCIVKVKSLNVVPKSIAI